MVEKFKHLICGDRKILAHCEDNLPIGGLHWKTHNNALFPQYADSLRNILGPLGVIYHVSSPSRGCGAVEHSMAMPPVVSVSRTQIVLWEFCLHSSATYKVSRNPLACQPGCSAEPFGSQ